MGKLKGTGTITPAMSTQLDPCVPNVPWQKVDCIINRSGKEWCMADLFRSLWEFIRCIGVWRRSLDAANPWEPWPRPAIALQALAL